MNAPSVRRCVAVCAVVLRVGPLAAQGVPAPPSLTVHTIWGTRDFASDLVSLAWMKDGKAYTTLDDASGSSDLYRVDAFTGKKDLLLRAADLVPPGARQPVAIEEYSFSADGSKLLIFTNSARVWRLNTKGTYYVWDLAAKRLIPVSTKRLPDVCQVLSRRPPRGLRARRQSVRHRPRERRRDRPHGRRRGERHQRHLRLGVRGGARSARRVPVEPRREAHRVLAARPVGHPAVLPREPGLALPAARPRALPQSRHAELRGEDRRDRARLRPYHVGGPRGGAGHLHRDARLRRLARRGLAHPPERSPEPARPVVGRCTHGRVARGHDGSRFRLGGRTPAAVDQRRPAVSVPIRSGRIHAGVSLQPRRLVRAPRDPGGL